MRLSRIDFRFRSRRSLSARAGFLSAAAWLALVGLAPAPSLAAQQDFQPGKAVSSQHNEDFSLGNQAIAAEWKVSGNALSSFKITDRRDGAVISVSEPFTIDLLGRSAAASGMHFSEAPFFRDLPVNPTASRYSDRVPGKEFHGALEDSSGDLRVDWSLVLRDGSNYLRQIVIITAPRTSLRLREVRLVDFQAPGARVEGSVAGSPIVFGNFFAGVENPLSASQVQDDRARAFMSRTLPLVKGNSVTYSSVIGVAAPGQMRRDFLCYLERERAHPYRTFLHYNSWFDLGMPLGAQYTQAAALRSIHGIGRQLALRRGVKLDSFLLDDGWDKHHSLWDFNQGFPNGLTGVEKAAKKYGAAPGIWLSPWGGYNKGKEERVAYGREQGLAIVKGGFALSAPKYYARFQQVCLQMIQKYDVNQFKFDGTGNADTVFPGSQFDSDFAAMIHLIGALRKAEPNIYINVTTGTHPSPFWLFTADSIWRGSGDTGQAGVGTSREKWITYRDAATYANVVTKAPLFPLNSLMLHGIVYGRSAPHGLNADPGHDFANEVHSFFGSGTQLQELYLTPSLLSKKNWDTLAEAAKWSRDNAAVLKDTHWVGGDPGKLEVYGWASWSPKEGILTLRNPSDHPQSISIRLSEAFQLPSGAPAHYLAKSPWKADARSKALRLDTEQAHSFALKPFQVLVLEMHAN